MPLISKTDLIVTAHNDKEKAGKHAVYTVTMETAPTHNPHMKVTLKSDNDVRTDFPLDQTFAVSISKEQETLDSNP